MLYRPKMTKLPRISTINVKPQKDRDIKKPQRPGTLSPEEWKEIEKFFEDNFPADVYDK